jgi:hypothetical protein
MHWVVMILPSLMVARPPHTIYRCEIGRWIPAKWVQTLDSSEAHQSHRVWLCPNLNFILEPTCPRIDILRLAGR